jgi:hypothetical protein
VVDAAYFTNVGLMHQTQNHKTTFEPVNHFFALRIFKPGKHQPAYRYIAQEAHFAKNQHFKV